MMYYLAILERKDFKESLFLIQIHAWTECKLHDALLCYTSMQCNPTLHYGGTCTCTCDCASVVFFYFVQSETTFGKFLALTWQLLSRADQQNCLRSLRAGMAYDSCTVKQTDAEWFAKCQRENSLWDSGRFTPSLEVYPLMALYPLMTLLSSAILREAGMIHPPPAVQCS